jgi:hypothetical protein
LLGGLGLGLHALQMEESIVWGLVMFCLWYSARAWAIDIVFLKSLMGEVLPHFVQVFTFLVTLLGVFSILVYLLIVWSPSSRPFFFMCGKALSGVRHRVYRF